MPKGKKGSSSEEKFRHITKIHNLKKLGLEEIANELGKSGIKTDAYEVAKVLKMYRKKHRKIKAWYEYKPKRVRRIFSDRTKSNIQKENTAKIILDMGKIYSITGIQKELIKMGIYKSTKDINNILLVLEQFNMIKKRNEDHLKRSKTRDALEMLFKMDKKKMLTLDISELDKILKSENIIFKLPQIYSLRKAILEVDEALKTHKHSKKLKQGEYKKSEGVKQAELVIQGMNDWSAYSAGKLNEILEQRGIHISVQSVYDIISKEIEKGNPEAISWEKYIGPRERCKTESIEISEKQNLGESVPIISLLSRQPVSENIGTKDIQFESKQISGKDTIAKVSKMLADEGYKKDWKKYGLNRTDSDKVNIIAYTLGAAGDKNALREINPDSRSWKTIKAMYDTENLQEMNSGEINNMLMRNGIKVFLKENDAEQIKKIIEKVQNKCKYGKPEQRKDIMIIKRWDVPQVHPLKENIELRKKIAQNPTGLHVHEGMIYKQINIDRSKWPNPIIDADLSLELGKLATEKGLKQIITQEVTIKKRKEIKRISKVCEIHEINGRKYAIPTGTATADDIEKFKRNGAIIKVEKK